MGSVRILPIMDKNKLETGEEIFTNMRTGEPYYAFDGKTADRLTSGSSGNGWWIAVKFKKPVCIKNWDYTPYCSDSPETVLFLGSNNTTSGEDGVWEQIGNDISTNNKRFLVYKLLMNSKGGLWIGFLEINLNGSEEELKYYNTTTKYLIQETKVVKPEPGTSPQYTETVVPYMNDTTTNRVTITSGTHLNDLYAYKAFAGGTWFSNYVKSDCIQIDFGENNSKTICKYSIQNLYTSSSPKDWTLEGSNDRAKWELLDNQVNQVSWDTGTTLTYIFKNTTKYRYYKLNITDSTGTNSTSSYIAINRMELMEMVKPKYEVNLYTFDGNNLIKSPSQVLDDNNFKTNGFNDATSINGAIKNIPDSILQWMKKNKCKLVMWTDDTAKTEAKLTYECEPFELINWLKTDPCKLLVYTDDTRKTECDMVYNCDSYRPLDKLLPNGKFTILKAKER